jgi:hypothetical protein
MLPLLKYHFHVELAAFCSVFHALATYPYGGNAAADPFPANSSELTGPKKGADSTVPIVSTCFVTPHAFSGDNWAEA